MARIRNVKPEFFRHESLQDLEQTHPQERPMLVYAGLWTQCSKNGVFKWKPRSLKLDILPFLDFDMGNALAILERHGFIIRFTKDGEEYGYIPKFLEHQAISHKEKDAPSTYPDYVEPQPGTVPEPSRNRSRPDPDTADVMTYDIGHRTKDEGQRTRDNGAPELPSISGPVSGANRDIFAGLLQTFLQVNGGKLPNMDTETRAIYELMQKTDNDPKKIQGIIKTYEGLIEKGDKFWKTKPMLASWIVKPGIWDQIQAASSRERREIDYPEPSPPPQIDDETARKNAEALRQFTRKLGVKVGV